MSITEDDIIECQRYFSSDFLELVSRAGAALRDIDHTDTLIQKIELVALLFDLVGTECVQKINSTDATSTYVNIPS